MARVIAVLGKLNLHAGRRTVVAGVLAAAGSMAYLVLDNHANVQSAFVKALLAGILTMVFLAVAQSGRPVVASFDDQLLEIAAEEGLETASRPASG